MLLSLCGADIKYFLTQILMLLSLCGADIKYFLSTAEM